MKQRDQVTPGRVDHVAVRVPNFDEALTFYRDNLGFEVEKEWGFGQLLPGARGAYLRLGAFRLEVVGGGDVHVPAVAQTVPAHFERGGWVHLGIAVPDIEALLLSLRAVGVEPFEGPMPLPIGGVAAFIHDPFGNVVELIGGGS